MMLPAKVSEDVRRLNPHVYGTPALKPEHVEAGRAYADEKALQARCEQWLELRGYRRLTPANAVRSGEPAGWFGHLSKPKGNAFMPDVFILHRARPPLLVELKVREDFRPGQLQMIERGDWRLARSLEDFASLVEAWESERKEKPV
jgi:hypothetical protein